jgi:hypothetical protein
MEPSFIKPRYDAGGFASLPQTIMEQITSRHYDTVVLFLIDAFGWRFFERFQDESFLKLITTGGSVRKLTSQFPSTTAAHITTIHTGQPVGEHGIFEWYYYEPLLDRVIAPLLNSFSGTAQRDTLKPAGVKPSRLYPIRNIYQPLRKQGLDSTIFQHREYTPSTYSDVLYHGAKAFGYKTLAEGLINLSEKLLDKKPPAYSFFYFDRIDAICHEYGPESAQLTAEILVFLMTMEHIFLKALAGNTRKILFLLTADHGQAGTDPKTTIYLNREPAFKGFEIFLKTNRAGEFLIPAGSARDFFLYIKPEVLDEARQFLSTRLDGRAEVWKVTDLMEAGYFGPVTSPEFLGHVGNLVILPFRGETVWWYEKDKFEQRFYGHHGGLTREEMEIPLIMWEM